jgi:glycosyltransferase involved in cell wall biosynthesis
VPSDFAAATFVARGIDRRRLIVNPYGVDAALYGAKAPRTRRERPSIVFVGGVGIRKGAPDLIRAFAPLRGRAELVMVGPVEPGIAAGAGPGIRFTGPLDRARLIGELHRADIFCLPSHEEGLPLSMLQAMAAGLPPVVTRETGVETVASDGAEALVVPAGAPAELGSALEVLIGDAARREAMGAAAARRAAGLRWRGTAERAVGAFREALARDN